MGSLIYCLGQVYALTMLYNLNNRNSLRQGPVNTSDGEMDNTTNIMNGIRECLHSLLEHTADA